MDIVQWREPDETTLDELTRWACFAADSAAIDSIGKGLTGAELTEVAVRAGLRMLLANGIITADLDGDTSKAYALNPPPAGR